MAIYVGGNKLNIRLGSTFVSIADGLMLKGVQLKTIDEYTLKDANGLYLTAKKE